MKLLHEHWSVSVATKRLNNDLALHGELERLVWDRPKLKRPVRNPRIKERVTLLIRRQPVNLVSRSLVKTSTVPKVVYIRDRRDLRKAHWQLKNLLTRLYRKVLVPPKERPLGHADDFLVRLVQYQVNLVVLT
jgi:hypothetical protein